MAKTLTQLWNENNHPMDVVGTGLFAQKYHLTSKSLLGDFSGTDEAGNSVTITFLFAATATWNLYDANKVRRRYGWERASTLDNGKNVCDIFYSEEADNLISSDARFVFIRRKDLDMQFIDES